MIVLCPYCPLPAVMVDSAEVYHGRSFGMIYLCRPCQPIAANLTITSTITENHGYAAT